VNDDEYFRGGGTKTLAWLRVAEQFMYSPLHEVPAELAEPLWAAAHANAAGDVRGVMEGVSGLYVHFVSVDPTNTPAALLSGLFQMLDFFTAYQVGRGLITPGPAYFRSD